MNKMLLRHFSRPEQLLHIKYETKTPRKVCVADSDRVELTFFYTNLGVKLEIPSVQDMLSVLFCRL